MNCVPLGVQALQLGEDDVLALAVDREGAVASLADPGVDGARGDPALLGEQLALRGDHPPAGAEPIDRGQASALGAAPPGSAVCLRATAAMLDGAVPGSSDADLRRGLPGSLALGRWRETQPAPGCGSRTPSGGWSSTAPGAMLVVGAAGSGRTEALAARLARLAPTGTAPEHVIVLTRSRAGGNRPAGAGGRPDRASLRGALDLDL